MQNVFQRGLPYPGYSNINVSSKDAKLQSVHCQDCLALLCARTRLSRIGMCMHERIHPYTLDLYTGIYGILFSSFIIPLNILIRLLDAPLVFD